MSLAIYEGTTLLSISYCDRKLNKLREKETLESMRGYDVTIGTLNRDKKLKELADSIEYYREVIEKLKKSIENVNDDEIIKFIIDQMIINIKKAERTKVSISFSYVSKYTVEVRVDNIFSTEVTFKRKAYEKHYYPNENYDGYNDTAEFVFDTTETSFLKEIISTVRKEINDKLPGIETH